VTVGNIAERVGSFEYTTCNICNEDHTDVVLVVAGINLEWVIY
jgi:hypothetical protein